MPELFLELLSEEIPARMQRKAADDLRRLVTDALVDAGLTYEGAYHSATPRRLVLSVSGLPARSADRTEERKGPRVGAPDKAVDGFLRAAGLQSVEEADIVFDPKKGDYYMARTTKPGRPTIDVAADIIPAAITKFPWPVSMRWGAQSVEEGALRWVRPLTSIIATFGAENEDPDIVPFAVPGVPVADTTVGHRFHAPDTIRVRRLDDYQKSLFDARVVVDFDRRRDQILHDARDRVFALGLELVEDDRLLDEVAGLVEWPVVLIGRFDEATLSLPDEVIRLTIRENQKCFVTRDAATGRLANAFVLTANTEAVDGGEAIIAGNERVVRARLADARFFYDTDLKVPLATHGAKLGAVTFHERLGTQADRVERIARLARFLAPHVGADPDKAETAARLAKADLATGMVGEFPELQGYMGRNYALAQGVDPHVAEAIEHHYAPLGPSDSVPTDPVSVAVGLADKADTLLAFWVIDEKPTGSGDPYGLRRAAIGLIRTILNNKVRLPLLQMMLVPFLALLQQRASLFNQRTEAMAETMAERGASLNTVARFLSDMSFPGSPEDVREDVIDFYAEVFDSLHAFLIGRLKVQLREEGARHDLVDAVFALEGQDDLVDVTRRIAALGAFLSTDDGANLMSGFRRAANILRAEEKKDGPTTGSVDTSHLSEAEEIALHERIEAARKEVTDAVQAEDYEASMRALAALRAPVDDFFETVMVNAPEPSVRLNRLRLLAAFRDVTREVADFSQISG